MLHEKLICYRKTIVLAEELSQISQRWPRGYGYLQDQLRRAMASVVLNCAEGNARRGEKERANFFQMARASLCEVGACLDLAMAFRLTPFDQIHSNKKKCYEISKILYALQNQKSAINNQHQYHHQ